MTDLLDLLAAAVDRYMAGCERVGDCLLRPVKHYGELTYGARDKRMLAHRAVYLVKNGPLEEGQIVRHSCDVPQCCEPTHLLAGTQAQNLRDSYERQRHRTSPGVRGERNPAAVLTAALVGQLRREVRAGTSIRTLASELGVAHSTVSNAVTGSSWRHVSEPPVRRRPARVSPHRTPDDVVEQARQLVTEGLSLSEVGERLGLNRVTVHRALARAS